MPACLALTVTVLNQADLWPFLPCLPAWGSRAWTVPADGARTDRRTPMPRGRGCVLDWSGNAALSNVNEALYSGGTLPPTMSVPTRSQSGCSALLRIHACRSGTPVFFFNDTATT